MLIARDGAQQLLDRRAEAAGTCTFAAVGLLSVGAAVIVGNDTGGPFTWGLYAVAATIAAAVTVGAWWDLARALSTWAVVRATTTVWFDAWVEAARLRAAGELKSDQVECQSTEADPAHGRAGHAAHRRAA